MFIDPELIPRRYDEHGRRLPDEPFEWTIVPFGIVFVAAFWAAVWVVGLLLSWGHWALFHDVLGTPFYVELIYGMLFLTGATFFFHLRDVQKRPSLAVAQILVGTTVGVFAVMTAPTPSAQIISAAASLITIANGIKTLRDILDSRRAKP